MLKLNCIIIVWNLQILSCISGSLNNKVILSSFNIGASHDRRATLKGGACCLMRVATTGSAVASRLSE